MSQGAGGAERRVTAALCLALVLNMAGTMTFPALIPTFIAEWSLTNSEAGWIGGVAFAGYVAVVPFVMGLTDRIDARRVLVAGTLVCALSAVGFAFAGGFWSAVLYRALGGIGHAATYMPGLKALTDRVEGPSRGRYQSFYTASYSIGSSLSLLQAGLVAGWFGWPAAFVTAGLLSFLALPLLLLPVRRHDPPPAEGGRRPGLLDLRPVLAQREAMAYVLAYACHCFELFGFRTWLVAFLTFAAAHNAAGLGEAGITLIATVVITLGLPSSILGNELATRLDRRRTLIVYMSASALCALVLALSTGALLWPLVLLVAVYAVLVMADSASLTVGAVAAARPDRRGATIAVHSFLGSLSALMSPLAVGLALDLGGGIDRPAAWSTAFLVLGGVVALGPVALYLLGRRPPGVASI
jgi:MFS family permease